MGLKFLKLVGSQFSLFAILFLLKVTTGNPVISMIDLFVPAKLVSI